MLRLLSLAVKVMSPSLYAAFGVSAVLLLSAMIPSQASQPAHLCASVLTERLPIPQRHEAQLRLGMILADEHLDGRIEISGNNPHVKAACLDVFPDKFRQI